MPLNWVWGSSIESKVCSLQIEFSNFPCKFTDVVALLIAETIVNEHPVTIYPGPKRVVPPRTLPGSIERHRDVCRKNTSSDLSSSSSSQELKSPIKELMSPTIPSSNGFILKNDDFIKRPKSPKSAAASPTNATPLGLKISIQTMDNLMNNRNIIHNAKMEQKMNLKNSKRNSKLSDDDEDKFSDDSLEDTSLPPSAPPIVVPPPPSLSAPVTPSKRHSIAWEVNLDDLCSTGNVFGSKVRFLHIFITFGRARSSSWALKAPQGCAPGSKFRLSCHPWHNLRKALCFSPRNLCRGNLAKWKKSLQISIPILRTLESELNFVSWHKPPLPVLG